MIPFSIHDLSWVCNFSIVIEWGVFTDTCRMVAVLCILKLSYATIAAFSKPGSRRPAKLPPWYVRPSPLKGPHTISLYSGVTQPTPPNKNNLLFKSFLRRLQLMESIWQIAFSLYFAGGGGGTPLYLLYGDVPLDRVWFSGIPVLNRVYNSRVCVLNRVFIPQTSSRVRVRVRARVRQNIKHVSEHGVKFKALYWYLRSSLEQGPKSKWTILNRVSYFPDYSLKQGQGFTVPAAHPYSITYRVPPPPPPGVFWSINTLINPWSPAKWSLGFETQGYRAVWQYCVGPSVTQICSVVLLQIRMTRVCIMFPQNPVQLW